MRYFIYGAGLVTGLIVVPFVTLALVVAISIVAVRAGVAS